jgi:hypothetical protein
MAGCLTCGQDRQMAFIETAVVIHGRQMEAIDEAGFCYWLTDEQFAEPKKPKPLRPQVTIRPSTTGKQPLQPIGNSGGDALRYMPPCMAILTRRYFDYRSEFFKIRSFPGRRVGSATAFTIVKSSRSDG